MLIREHKGVQYAIEVGYLGDEEAWMLELSEARHAPESWSESFKTVPWLPGEAFLMALVPDEDLDREPSLHLFGPNGKELPHAVMLWFMEVVAEEVARCRANLEQARPSDPA
ncbi:hypothetical protein K3N28_01415 [Glycomyces sp. TRM65418]|uniref:hypothetical protein n=1 Tax=Glycomyces sp. TRM65418 TaxID=2867006 RepID=UPI001CE6E8E5|nr:hypothetical protein [Glycomyces sp. TRM65418]MCC3761731.1 hypothetical protein [Glycomyces sp. TRM65418]QZD55818.1 hypothetical protein K3N28_01405 [Glycomyces sp. TRM65418]